MIIKHATRASAFLAALLLCLAPAIAGQVNSGVFGQATMSGTDGNESWEMRPTLNVSDDGSFSLSEVNVDRNGFDTTVTEFSGNVDPTIAIAFNVQNNTLVVQDYTFIFTIPIVAQTPATITGGSGGIVLSDGDTDGAVIGPHTNGRPTYTSQIDGADYVPLTFAPIVLPGSGTDADFDSFGTPIPSMTGGPAALSTIGIRYDFSLTPGDVAGVSGNFTIEAVPEPAAMVLLIGGGMLLAGARRFA